MSKISEQVNLPISWDVARSELTRIVAQHAREINSLSVLLQLTDGVSAPDPVAGVTQIYVDSADGDLKVQFGDGTIKTIATDT